MVAHNAPFDLSFLAAELEIARLPLPGNPVIDTLTLTRRVYSLARNSLSAVVAAVALGACRREVPHTPMKLGADVSATEVAR